MDDINHTWWICERCVQCVGVQGDDATILEIWYVLRGIYGGCAIYNIDQSPHENVSVCFSFSSLY